MDRSADISLSEAALLKLHGDPVCENVYRAAFAHVLQFGVILKPFLERSMPLRFVCRALRSCVVAHRSVHRSCIYSDSRTRIPRA